MGSNEESNDLDLPYWQVNIPLPEREQQCPDYLSNLSQKDIGIISTPDSEYKILTWTTVQSIVHSNQLHLFQRKPSELRRYLAYMAKLRAEYGSVMEFVLSHRLNWSLPVKMEGEKPFSRDEDLKVLCNDWPYGIDERIVHLVVWTKFELVDQVGSDDLTEEARKEIEEFVDERFCKRVGRENVIWFKNWKTLKSVHAVEHFHVMLFDPPPEFVSEVTNGDVPLSKKV